ncbi:MAG TPA: hypothetical protein VF814_07750 [Casimicrobiaceae bacterium]
MKKRPSRPEEFVSADGPLLTLESALERARKGRPGPLLALIYDAMGADVAAVIHGLIGGEIKLAKPYRGKYLPREAEGIRAFYQQLRKQHPKKSKDQLIDDYVMKAFGRGIARNTIADIIEAKNTYRKPKPLPPRQPGAAKKVAAVALALMQDVESRLGQVKNGEQMKNAPHPKRKK